MPLREMSFFGRNPTLTGEWQQMFHTFVLMERTGWTWATVEETPPFIRARYLEFLSHRPAST